MQANGQRKIVQTCLYLTGKGNFEHKERPSLCEIRFERGKRENKWKFKIGVANFAKCIPSRNRHRAVKMVFSFSRTRKTTAEQSLLRFVAVER